MNISEASTDFRFVSAFVFLSLSLSFLCYSISATLSVTNVLSFFFLFVFVFCVCVFFCQARNLPAADSNGLMDPYLKIKFNGKVRPVDKFCLFVLLSL